METVPLFQDCRLKLQRAEHHMRCLRDLAASHSDKHPPIRALSRGPDNADGTPHYNLSIRLKQHPPEFGGILGDVIHNLRASLDLLAVDLVRSVSGNTKGVYFPFCDDAAFLDQMIKDKKFHRAGADAVAEVKRLQPYKGGNVILRALHDLDVQDKHHSVIPTATMAGVSVEAAIVDGVPVVRPGPDIDPVIVFPDDSILAGQPIFDTLEDLTQMTSSIIQTFEALVASRS